MNTTANHIIRKCNAALAFLSLELMLDSCERWLEVGGPLGPVLGGMLGPQVSKEFGTLLSNLARMAETT